MVCISIDQPLMFYLGRRSCGDVDMSLNSRHVTTDYGYPSGARIEKRPSEAMGLQRLFQLCFASMASGIRLHKSVNGLGF